MSKTDPSGRVLASRTLTANQLVLGAGSVGTSELLVRAKALGTLPLLNDYVGAGWGTNGDAAVVRSVAWNNLFKAQGVPSRSRIIDERGDLPVTLENWYVPLLPLDIGIVGSLAMTLDPTRARFYYDRATNRVKLDWKKTDSARSVAAIRVVNDRIAKANGLASGVPLAAPDVNASFTAHPLGGAVLGDVTDELGRVKGYPGLYVLDGALIPGNTGTVNPSLTIAALAERNIEAVLDAGD